MQKFGLENKVIKNIVEILKKYEEVESAKIFGSRARGDFNAISDIDIAVFEEVKKEDEYKIRNEFDKLNIIYKIDLVFIDKQTKEELLQSIIRDGVDF